MTQHLTRPLPKTRSVRSPALILSNITRSEVRAAANPQGQSSFASLFIEAASIMTPQENPHKRKLSEQESESVDESPKKLAKIDNSDIGTEKRENSPSWFGASSVETSPVEAFPMETVSVEAFPAEIPSLEAVPMEIAPVETVAVEMTPVVITPIEMPVPANLAPTVVIKEKTETPQLKKPSMSSILNYGSPKEQFKAYKKHVALSDHITARIYLKAAAANEYPPAQLEIGRVYQNGLLGLAKDDKKAAYYFKKASSQKTVAAQHVDRSVGAQPHLVKQPLQAIQTPTMTPASADVHFARTLKHGSDVEQFRLGTSYLKGENGLKKDDKKAFQLFLKAADKGLAPAQNRVGTFYFQGLGDLKKDNETALGYFIRSAEQNFPTALNNMGIFYEKGLCKLPVNLEEALCWYQKAASKGLPEAQHAIDRLKAQGVSIAPTAKEKYVQLCKIAKTLKLQGTDFASIVKRTGLTKVQIANL